MKNKPAFTLVHLLITFVVLSVILVAAAPMVTRGQKKITTRAPHGKYFCYWGNDGKLYEEYFNSRTRVSKIAVDECKFNSPTKVATYQVEVIGAGAGGNYYKEIEDTLSENLSGEFSIKGKASYSGESHISPSADVLKKAYNGKTITECAETGKGQDGQGLKIHEYFAKNTYCEVTNSSTNTVFYSQEYKNYAITKGTTNPISIYGELEAKCQSICAGDPLLQCRLGTNPTERTINGGKGSPNSYIKYNYTIDLSSYNSYNEIKSTLNNTVGSIREGFSNGSKKYFTTQSVKEVNFQTDLPIQGKNGESQNGYAYIKGVGRTINAEPAQGGEGAKVNSNGVEEAVADKPITGDYTSCSENYPILKAIGATNTRNYKYGIAGLAGEYLMSNYAQLDANCKIKIGKGGLAGNEIDEKGKPGEETSFICDNINIDMKSKGAESTSTQHYTSSSLNIFDNFSRYGWGKLASKCSECDAYEVGRLKGEWPSGYNQGKNIFTNYRNLPEVQFGKGGNGNGITDTKLELWGWEKYTMGSSIIQKNEYDKNYSNEEIDSGALITLPENGGSGVVIITW